LRRRFRLSYGRAHIHKEQQMAVGYGPIIVVIVFLVLIASMPIWPFSRRWGYRPSIALGIIFTMIAVFVAIGGFGPA
jgi:low affinity Fe/Cu permease